MKKTLSERIAERVLKKTASPYAKNRAIFLTFRAEIKQALDDGWSVLMVWKQLKEEKKIDFSYQSFRKYVNRLIPKEKIEKDKDPAVTTDGSKKTPPKIGGFNFNATPKKEDLL